MYISFRSFIEELDRSDLKKADLALGGKDKNKDEKPENYLDGIWRELGIDPNSLPDYIESGPIEISDENVVYNQAIWKVIKPIDLKDKFVRIQFWKGKSPNLNQHAYRRQEDGKLIPYEGEVRGKVHLIPIEQFAELISRGWQGAIGGGGAGGLPGLGGLGGMV